MMRGVDYLRSPQPRGKISLWESPNIGRKGSRFEFLARGTPAVWMSVQASGFNVVGLISAGDPPQQNRIPH